MISRALHMERSYFLTIGEPTIIPDQAPVVFTSVRADFFLPHPDDTSTVKLNHIIYYTDINKFVIITTPTTQNDFLILWAVCLSGCNSTLMPTFAALIETKDQNGNFIPYATFPGSGSRKTDTLCGSALVQLPPPQVGRTDYYVSLVNQTGAECHYNTRVYQFAAIFVTSINPSS